MNCELMIPYIYIHTYIYTYIYCIYIHTHIYHERICRFSIRKCLRPYSERRSIFQICDAHEMSTVYEYSDFYMLKIPMLVTALKWKTNADSDSHHTVRYF
jgi:hypothetical protein